MKLVPLYPEGKIKALTFSYDDGSRHDLKLAEIFNRFGWRDFRYISALQRLETSADAGILYNPSAISLWFRKESRRTL